MRTTDPTDDLRRNLHDDETLQWVVRPHRRARFVSKLTSGLFGAAVLGVFVGIFAYMWGNENVTLGIAGFAVPIALQVVSAFLGLFFDKIEYAATDQRLMDYRGRFGRSLTSVPFDGIQDAEYQISAVENLFDVGTVSIDTDRGYETMTFQQTPGPQEFSREVVSLASQSGEQSEEPVRPAE